jgi:hypothetical protein
MLCGQVVSTPALCLGGLKFKCSLTAIMTEVFCSFPQPLWANPMHGTLHEATTASSQILLVYNLSVIMLLPFYVMSFGVYNWG